MAALAPPRTIKDASGQLAFDLALSGPPLHPAANGTIALDNLSVQVIPLGLKIDRSFAHMRMTPDQFTLEQMVVKADGTITAHGNVALANYMPGAVNLNVTINQFPAIHTQQYQAAIGGALHLGGTPEAPDVTGRLKVIQATIHPDLAFLTASKYSRDDTIVVIRPGEAMPANANGESAANNHLAPRPAPAASQASHSSLFDQLAINVAVIVHRNTWIRHPDASVELAGQIHVLKVRGGLLTLVGEIDTVRGWITFNNQIFTWSRAKFSSPGPYDHSVAQSRRAIYRVELHRRCAGHRFCEQAETQAAKHSAAAAVGHSVSIALWQNQRFAGSGPKRVAPAAGGANGGWRRRVNHRQIAREQPRPRRFGYRRE